MNVFFTVTGDFLTQQARDFWAEDKYSSALKILDMDGLPTDEKIAILAGKRKLVGNNEFELEDDSWDPLNDGGWHEYPDFNTAMRRKNWKKIQFFVKIVTLTGQF